jgi:hypothetical protein
MNESWGCSQCPGSPLEDASNPHIWYQIIQRKTGASTKRGDNPLLILSPSAVSFETLEVTILEASKIPNLVAVP